MFATKYTCPVFFSILFSFSYDGFSQRASLPKWEAGINVGGYIYQGDLTIHRFGSIETIQPGVGISGTRIINRAFSARLLFNMARLVGDESIYKYPEWRQQRNFSFTASVKELSLLVHWNVLGSNYDERKFEPYLFAGGGVSFVNIKRNYSKVNPVYFGEHSPMLSGLAVDAVTPTPKMIPVIPVGAGLRYNLSDRIAINGEASYRLMHTDYLDGFSMSANPKLKDHYSSITIGVAYKFGNKEKYGCPVAN